MGADHVPLLPEPAPLQLARLGGFPASFAIDLARRLSRRLSVPCRVLPDLAGGELPRLQAREQVDADAVLAQLEAAAASPGPLVGLTDLDIAIPIFTFVFGRARHGGRAALVSVARLDAGFYGLPPDAGLLAGRAVNEILHELGHVGGLLHCKDPDCLMKFAASVEAVDLRGGTFCASCASLLPRWLGTTASPLGQR